jgi:Domain of unknown function (DUF3127)
MSAFFYSYHYIIMEFQGKIIFKSGIETVGQNAMQKQAIVLEEVTDREIKGSILVEQLGDKVNMIAEYNIGDVIKVSLNTRAKEYNGRYYNSVGAWKVELITRGNGASAAAAQSDGDLPF